jgi:sigma-B regulation protein RsbU (phosphoserine phosphatase)
MGAALTNMAIAEQLRCADAEIRREVDQIAALQRAMLPDGLPRVPGLALAASYKTFGRAGGDYYDVFPAAGAHAPPRSDGRWSVLIADASGHGPAAAVLVAMLSGILHAFPGEPRSPVEMIEFLNRHLSARRLNGAFVTAIFGLYDPADATLTYATAGHNPPLLRHANGADSITLHEEIGGIPLGIDAQVGSNEGAICLEPGDTLLLYTDGVIDERGPDHRPFGLDGLIRVVRESSGEPGGLVATLNDRLTAHQGPTRPEDDQTLLALHALPTPPAKRRRR